MEIEVQGKIVLQKLSPIFIYPKVFAIAINLKSKYGEVSTGSSWEAGKITPYLSIEPCKDSMHLKKTKIDATHITFPEYESWSILTAEVSRYTLNVVFWKLEE